MADETAAPVVQTSGQHIALTGATGFVGRALLAELERAQGQVQGQVQGRAQGASRITALCRGGAARGQKLSQQINWIAGDLDDTAACAALVKEADVVIHLAGLTKALDPADFHKINAESAARLAGQAAAAGVRHFIFMSSLAAMRPEVSHYAASKAAAEELVSAAAGQMPVTILRAPAVLGPGDDATAPLIAMLQRGLATAPGGAARNSRFSIIDVQDLARLLAECAANGPQSPTPRAPLAPYSERAVGYDDLARTSRKITGRRVRILWLPRPLVQLAGHLADLIARIRRKPDVFGSDKVREVYAGDWIADMAVTDPTSLETTLRGCFDARSGAKPMATRHAPS